MSSKSAAEYERGFVAGHIEGKIDARLAEHDKHFDKINGSMARVAVALETLTLEVASLRQLGIADKATVIQTASALKDAEQGRRDRDKTEREQSDRHWTPKARFIAVIGSIVLVASFVLGAWQAFK